MDDELRALPLDFRQRSARITLVHAVHEGMATAPRVSNAPDGPLPSRRVPGCTRAAKQSPLKANPLWEPLVVRQWDPQWTTAKVLHQTLRDVWAGQAMEWAAALSFYGVLSVFPLLAAGAAVASSLIPPSVVTTRLSLFVEGLLPAGVVDVDPIVAAAIAARGQVGLSVIVLWLLAGRHILGALVTALDRVSDVDARHETVRRRALVELITLAGIGLLFLLALVARSLLGVVWEAVWGAGASTPVRWAARCMSCCWWPPSWPSTPSSRTGRAIRVQR